MDKRGLVVIHCNPVLRNQRVYSEYLKQGFEVLHYNTKITSNPSEKGDIHVCIGPHYALQQNLGKPTIYLDRCLWGDDMEAVSIGWVREDGGMVYPKECDNKRQKPRLKPWTDNKNSRALFLCDYGGFPDFYYNMAVKEYDQVEIRYHPSQKAGQPSLLQHLEGCSVAIGMRSSALVYALIHGYPVISFDYRSPVASVTGRGILDIEKPDRSQWLNNMSYSQWKGSEIASGEALEYVLTSN